MAKATKESNLIILGRDFPAKEDEIRSLTSRINEVVKMGTISSETLSTGLKNIVQGMNQALSDVDESLSNYELEEITIKLEISASGQVAILGNGIGVSGSGGIELKFVYKK
jgi:hypothetical protein